MSSQHGREMTALVDTATGAPADWAGVEFVSAPIRPAGGALDARPMSRGEPGLPAAFAWRHEVYVIRAILRSWKESSREGGSAGGELYLRRHCYELLMADDSRWSVYFTRQPGSAGSAKTRWFLYSIRHGDHRRVGSPPVVRAEASDVRREDPACPSSH